MTPKDLERFGRLQVRAHGVGFDIKARKGLKRFMLVQSYLTEKDKDDKVIFNGTLTECEHFIMGAEHVGFDR